MKQDLIDQQVYREKGLLEAKRQELETEKLDKKWNSHRKWYRQANRVLYECRSFDQGMMHDNEPDWEDLDPPNCMEKKREKYVYKLSNNCPWGFEILNNEHDLYDYDEHWEDHRVWQTYKWSGYSGGIKSMML